MAPVTERRREKAREFLALRTKFDMGDPVASLAALLAEVEAPLQARCAALEAFVGKLFVDGVPGGWPDDDENCPKGWERWTLLLFGHECGDTLVGGEAFDHFRKLSGSDSALKPLLVRAARTALSESDTWGAPDSAIETEANAIAERVMRGE